MQDSPTCNQSKNAVSMVCLLATKTSNTSRTFSPASDVRHETGILSNQGARSLFQGRESMEASTAERDGLIAVKTRQDMRRAIKAEQKRARAVVNAEYTARRQTLKQRHKEDGKSLTELKRKALEESNKAVVAFFAGRNAALADADQIAQAIAAYDGQNPDERDAVSRPCVVCATPFNVQTTDSTKRFCSDACRQRAYRQRQQ